MVVSLLESKSFGKRADDFQTALSSMRALEIAAPLEKTLDPLKYKLSEWLSQEGFYLNPFEFIDAGMDPFIPFYLIGHNQFENVNGKQPAFVFAPAGGGKTAFRVRLVRECRAGRNGRRVFPIVYKPTGLGYFDVNMKQLALRQRTELLRYASQELFLQLAYFPYVLDEMDEVLKKVLLQTVSWDLDFPIAYYLHQVKEAGTLKPIITAFDPTACSLPNPPGREDIAYLCKKLIQYPSDTEKPDDEKRLDILFDLILNKLKFVAIYILVDEVDSFFETANSTRNMLKTISWLLDNSLGWAQKNIYVKFFLPDEIHWIITDMPGVRSLISKSKIINIKWDAYSLSEVIRQRLQVASDGKFDSFAAFSDRALRASGRSPEETLISILRQYERLSPRSLIRAVNWLFVNHVCYRHGGEKLNSQDLIAVREWIRNEYSGKE